MAACGGSPIAPLAGPHALAALGSHGPSKSPPAIVSGLRRIYPERSPDECDDVELLLQDALREEDQLLRDLVILRRLLWRLDELDDDLRSVAIERLLRARQSGAPELDR